MYARVVRFTEVDPDHLAGRLEEVDARDAPPVDIPAKKVQILHDSDQRTAVVIPARPQTSKRAEVAGARCPVCTGTRWIRRTSCRAH
jgi:hypothetical protein